MAADPTPISADEKGRSGMIRDALQIRSTHPTFLSAVIGVLLSAFIGAFALTRRAKR
jgi:hypothetical protein